MKYKVAYTGQGAGYNVGDIIYIPDNIKELNKIAWQINAQANLSFLDLGFLSGDKNKMTLGTRMDGITFRTPVLVVEKLK